MGMEVIGTAHVLAGTEAHQSLASYGMLSTSWAFNLSVHYQSRSSCRDLEGFIGQGLISWFQGLPTGQSVFGRSWSMLPFLCLFQFSFVISDCSFWTIYIVLYVKLDDWIHWLGKTMKWVCSCKRTCQQPWFFSLNSPFVIMSWFLLLHSAEASTSWDFTVSQCKTGSRISNENLSLSSHWTDVKIWWNCL